MANQVSSTAATFFVELEVCRAISLEVVVSREVTDGAADPLHAGITSSSLETTPQ
jgi:hypothetical protein